MSQFNNGKKTKNFAGDIEGWPNDNHHDKIGLNETCSRLSQGHTARRCEGCGAGTQNVPGGEAETCFSSPAKGMGSNAFLSRKCKSGAHHE